MEVQCIREALLRPNAYQLRSFLAPSLSRPWRSRSPAAYSCHKNLRSNKHLSTSASFKADGSSPKASKNSNKDADAHNHIRDLLNRTSDEQVPSINTLTTSQRSQLNTKISAKFDELFPKEHATPPRSATAVEMDKAYRRFMDKNRNGLKLGSIANSMLMPDSISGYTSAPGALGDKSGQPRRRSKRTIRSRPTVGRTVEVEEAAGVDLGRAFSKLSGLLFENNVRKDQILQKYHERPGLKRKRLKHERWTKYFKTGFAATVQRAVQMRKQGW